MSITAALVENNEIINVIVVESLDFMPGLIPLPEGTGVGYRYVDGQWIAPATPEPTPEETIKMFTDAIQARLDAFARTRGYDGILSACTYVTSTVMKFAAEGQYCVEARDTTWATAYSILADVESGERPMPTIEDVFAELPVLEWPA